MADDLQDLRSEYADVSKRLTRVALLTLAILLVAVVAYTRAFAKLRENDVRDRLASIQNLMNEINKTKKTKPDVSYVFAWSLQMPKEEPFSGLEVLDQPAATYSGHEAELVRQAEKLETDAGSWFKVKFSLLGSSIEGDLRYWILLLPLFLLCANFYLAVTREKALIIERVANAHIHKLPSDQPARLLDQLFFSERSSYTRYPSRLGSVSFVLISAALVGYLVFISSVIWHQWDPALIGSFVWTTLIVVCWAAAYCCWIGEKLETQADGIVSAIHQVSAGPRLHRWLTSTLMRWRQWAKKGPRLTLSSGLALLTVSLLLPLAKCGGTTFSGFDVLRGKDRSGESSFGAWFVQDSPNSYSDLYISRFAYVTVIAFAATALLALMVSLIRRGYLSRYAKFAAPFGLLLAWYVIIDAAFAYPVTRIFWAADVVRTLLFLIPLCFWIRWPGMKREAVHRRRERLFSLLIAAYLPALILGPVSLTELAVRGVPGYDAFFFGTLLVALGIDAIGQTESAPAVPPQAHPSTRSA